ncbi:hypothetical protein SUGI_0077930 [Cryptomeria japonica]|uniref:uncharacterized protein LOC131028067 n=1 Tax=Cryptomeria japonica TaxID=3369 RepID=UPI002408CF4D|nr:uncharacterized protein LOC131028067 [Cryptomeria japonica]GLJ07935.1 hypothetical protein SUGI_0077930 [Cryptomeria japonica]
MLGDWAGGCWGAAARQNYSISLRYHWNKALSESAKNHAENFSNENTGKKQWRFPLKAATTSGSLVLIGDTIAQVRGRWLSGKNSPEEGQNKGILQKTLYAHDWLRALRMTSYGFLLYGPGTQAWYEFLDRVFVGQSLRNLSIKVALNQIVVGPCVVGVIFAWNSLWLRKLKELPTLYQKEGIPTLIAGWKFWVPITVLNFWVVPLHTRVAFMSTCSIFWNFYLSTAMGKS